MADMTSLTLDQGKTPPPPPPLPPPTQLPLSPALLHTPGSPLRSLSLLILVISGLFFGRKHRYSPSVKLVWTLTEMSAGWWSVGGGACAETSVSPFVQSEESISYTLIKFNYVFITLMLEMDNPAGYVSASCQCECVRVCDIQLYAVVMLSWQQCV